MATLAPGVGANDVSATPGNPTELSPLSQSVAPTGGRFQEDFNAVRPTSTLVSVDSSVRDGSILSSTAPTRSGTLKKKASISRKSSMVKRSGSKRNSRAGSVRSLLLDGKTDGEGSERNSAFFTPVPTNGNPTEVLAQRFQGESTNSPLVLFGSHSAERYEQELICAPYSLEEGLERLHQLLSRSCSVIRE
jgi:hypothetical protein